MRKQGERRRVDCVEGESGMGLPLGPGDKRQLMSKDATAKLVRANILTKVPKTILFCITPT